MRTFKVTYLIPQGCLSADSVEITVIEKFCDPTDTKRILKCIQQFADKQGWYVRRIEEIA